MTAVQRNDFAALHALIDSGKLKLTQMTLVNEIRHQVGCPMWVSSYSQTCDCRPRVFVLGKEVEP